MILTEEKIRERIKQLCQTNPRIHLDVSIPRPKRSIQNIEVTLVGAYAHVFRVEEQLPDETKFYTIQYADILIGHVKVAEL